MSSLLFEVCPADGDWRPVGMLGPGDRPEQLSILTADGRDVLLFRCDGHQAVIYRSIRSLAITAAQQSELGVQEVHLVDAEAPVAKLGKDLEVFELILQPYGKPPFGARWTWRAYD